MSDVDNLPEVGTFQCTGIQRSARWRKSSGGHVQLDLDLNINFARNRQGIGAIFLVFAGGMATDICLDQLRALGWKGTAIRKLDGVGSVVAKVRITHEPWNGRMRAKYQVLTPREGEDLSDDELARFEAQIGGYMAAGVEGSGSLRYSRESDDADDRDAGF